MAEGANNSSWKISNLIRSNRMEPGHNDKSSEITGVPHPGTMSQPSTAPNSANPSPAHSFRKGINLLPEVVSFHLYLFLRLLTTLKLNLCVLGIYLYARYLKYYFSKYINC